MRFRPRRVIEKELLDTASLEEARANLADLARINRYFGGHRTLVSLLARHLPPSGRFRALDVGAAGGDMGRAAAAAYPRSTIVHLDKNDVHLGAAPDPRVVADAFRLPFPDDSFDVVWSSLLLHHFDADQVVELLREMARVTRNLLIAIDLHRHPVAFHFLPMTARALGWHHVTLADGPTSVQAGFQVRELRDLAMRAALPAADVRHHWPWFRLSLTSHR